MKGGAIRTLYTNPANAGDLPKPQAPAGVGSIPEIVVQGLRRQQAPLERTYIPKDASYSEELVKHVKEREGLRYSPYPDPGAGYPTIGYGHKLEGPYDPRMQWTEQRAAEQLRRDLDDAVVGVRGKVKVPLTQGQIDALTSMFMNLGPERFSGTQADKKLHAGDYIGAATELLTFDNVRKDGKLVPLPGLTTRRRNEAEMFAGPHKHLLPPDRPKTR